MKLFSNKRGAGACGGGGLASLMPFLILGLIIFMAVKQCEDKKDREKAYQALMQECPDQSGTVCLKTECKGKELPLSGTIGNGGKTLAYPNGEPKICCSLACNQAPSAANNETAINDSNNATINTTINTSNILASTSTVFLNYAGGDASRTCAAQLFGRCGADEYCRNDQWMRSSDGYFCCAGPCDDRMQDTLALPTGETVIVERVSVGFIVWYGDNAPTLGERDFVNAAQVPGGYSFILNGAAHQFSLVEDTETSIAVQYGISDISCPTDVQACDDGSTVGRIPPDCNFAEC